MSRLKTREVLVALIACTGISDPCWAQGSGQECSVHIVQPKGGESVKSPENVTGTAHIPVGTKLWVLAHRKGLAVWWPQGGASADLSGSEWAVLTFFGEPRDCGADFEVTARVFDERQSAALEAGVKHTSDIGQFPGITTPSYFPSCGAETVSIRKQC